MYRVKLTLFSKMLYNFYKTSSTRLVFLCKHTRSSFPLVSTRLVLFMSLQVHRKLATAFWSSHSSVFSFHSSYVLKYVSCPLQTTWRALEESLVCRRTVWINPLLAGTIRRNCSFTSLRKVTHTSVDLCFWKKGSFTEAEVVKHRDVTVWSMILFSPVL